MSLWDENELERYNKNILKKRQKELESLRDIAKRCEIKEPIFNNGFNICRFELDCLRKD